MCRVRVSALPTIYSYASTMSFKKRLVPLRYNITMSAPVGNNYAMKYKTSEERQALCQKYIDYVKLGRSKEYFPECDYDTFQRYCRDFPEDFPTEKIAEAERTGLGRLEEFGFAGMLGKIPGFNVTAWIFIMKNRAKWRDKFDVTSNEQEIKMPTVFIPKEIED